MIKAHRIPYTTLLHEQLDIWEEMDCLIYDNHKSKHHNGHNWHNKHNRAHNSNPNNEFIGKINIIFCLISVINIIMGIIVSITMGILRKLG